MATHAPTTRVHTPGHRWTFESALEFLHKSNSVSGSEEWLQDVAKVMAELDCGTWHASHLVWLDAVNAGKSYDGKPLANDCTICGGKCDPRQTAHSLCEARLKAGRDEIPVLDIRDKTCDCFSPECVAARARAR